jgi:hypothetical protein
VRVTSVQDRALALAVPVAGAEPENDDRKDERNDDRNGQRYLEWRGVDA